MSRLTTVLRQNFKIRFKAPVEALHEKIKDIPMLDTCQKMMRNASSRTDDSVYFHF